MKRYFVIAAFALLFPQLMVMAQATEFKSDTVKLVVVVERHGVRSPTSKTSQLNQYSSQPWPEWSVPPGYLTEHGAALMTLFGTYDRALFAGEGLIASSGCSDVAHVSFIADSDQRTRETGRALADGMFPGCKPEVHALKEGTPDPLFHTLAASVGSPDYSLAAASVSGRLGGDPNQLLDVYRPALLTMDRVLRGCKPDGPCAPTAKPATPLLDIPSSLMPGSGSHLVNLHGPLNTAASLAENMLLEFTEGMPMDKVGWGNVDEKTLRDLVQLHTAASDLSDRAPYTARVQSSNLLTHMLLTMRQSVEGKAVPGALGRAGDRVVFLVGHDTNLSNIAGALDLSWMVDGRRNDTPPGSTLVFELHEETQSHAYFVKAFYMTQTLDQMRNATALTLSSPPARVPLFLPGCSSATNECTWQGFEKVIDSVVYPSFTVNH